MGFLLPNDGKGAGRLLLFSNFLNVSLMATAKSLHQVICKFPLSVLSQSLFCCTKGLIN